MRLVIASILILFLFLTACNTQTQPEKIDVKQEHLESPDFCEKDSDCICKGVYDGRCFIGNKAFYDKYLDKDADCPIDDYCQGPYGNMAIRCVGKCVQLPK